MKQPIVDARGSAPNGRVLLGSLRRRTVQFGEGNLRTICKAEDEVLPIDAAQTGSTGADLYLAQVRPLVAASAQHRTRRHPGLADFDARRTGSTRDGKHAQEEVEDGGARRGCKASHTDQTKQDPESAEGALGHSILEALLHKATCHHQHCSSSQPKILVMSSPAGMNQPRCRRDRVRADSISPMALFVPEAVTQEIRTQPIDQRLGSPIRGVKTLERAGDSDTPDVRAIREPYPQLPGEKPVRPQVETADLIPTEHPG
ncbi:MAG: hypothetical protein U0P45_11940 [Acidimicrobiales bacterium]